MTLGRIVAGVQRTLMVSDREVSRPLQALEALEIVAVAAPWATLETFDPVVVHPVALTEIVVDSAPVEFVVSGGENDTAPVTDLQLTPPVARVLELDVGLELQAVASPTTTPSARMSARLDVRIIDTLLLSQDALPWPSPARR